METLWGDTEEQQLEDLSPALPPAPNTAPAIFPERHKPLQVATAWRKAHALPLGVYLGPPSGVPLAPPRILPLLKSLQQTPSLWSGKSQWAYVTGFGVGPLPHWIAYKGLHPVEVREISQGHRLRHVGPGNIPSIFPVI